MDRNLCPLFHCRIFIARSAKLPTLSVENSFEKIMDDLKAAFHKYQALGNDMIVVDPAHFSRTLDPPLIHLLCDRHFGIGADGICYGPLFNSSLPNEMRFFNPDGTEAQKSGNGLRVFARYLCDAAYVTADEFPISIHGATMQAKILEPAAAQIAITMGHLSFNSKDIPLRGKSREVIGEQIQVGEQSWHVTAVSVGNPHCIIFSDNLAQIHTVGPRLETAVQFPERTNVQIVHVLDQHNIRITIWERGAGYTLASGTSACATAGAALRHGFCRSPITVNMEGGSADVTIDEAWQATLVGEVMPLYHGTLSGELLRAI
jgi:diaminopimelate epimerase